MTDPLDNLIHQLEALEAPQLIEVNVPLDDDGYYDRRCPAEECGAAFKVAFTDWKEKVPDERAWCAICGELAEPSQFNTPDQERYFAERGLSVMLGQIDDAMSHANGRKLADGFITVTFSYQPGERPAVVPAVAEPILTQRSECELCGCQFASLGAAFFCPACGHNGAASTFAEALATVRHTMDLAEGMADLVADRDRAANIARHLSENALGRVWSSFQRLAEASYAAQPASATKPARKNAFQSLGASAELWRHAIGKTYDDILSESEQADLVRLVQARHVLEHQDGIVDADYVAHSGDGRYTVGQRLVVASKDVRRLADICERLAGLVSNAVGDG